MINQLIEGFWLYSNVFQIIILSCISESFHMIGSILDAIDMKFLMVFVWPSISSTYYVGTYSAWQASTDTLLL